MVNVPDFDTLYRADPDPWQVASSFYEQRKRAVLLASLTRATYASAWDPGCGTGELAAQLATRAEAVLATDTSAEAVRLTAARCAELPRVAAGRIRQPGLPDPGNRDFDLIVVAEFAYYLTASDRAEMWRTISTAASEDAEIVVIHWRHDPHDAHLSGLDVNAEAVRALTSEPGWRPVVRHDDQDFVLDVLRRDAS
jgi:SAM-dependent methyltransferase